jgi:hypothetical protein
LNPGIRSSPPGFNPNSDVGTVMRSGAGFQPVISGKQGWKNLPQLPGGN